MEYIIIYLVTIFASFAIEVVGELSFIKDLAIKGYKLDIKKTTENVTEEQRKMNLLKKLIPLYNIFYSLKQLSKYEKQKRIILENPNENQSLVQMNKIEKELFNEKPKSITALNLAISPINENNYRKPNGIISISNGVYRDENNDGTYTQITFRKETDKIVVTHLEGKILLLDIETQQQELNKIFNTLYKLNVVIEYKENITEQKEALISHREEILKQKDQLKLTLK